VKGLIFNLLDSMARQSGCADEAWDLVLEFVAGENAADEADEVFGSELSDCFREPESLEASIDAVLQSIGREEEAEEAELLELPRLPFADPAYKSFPELGAGAFRARDVAAADSFGHDLLSLLEQLLAEALTDDDDDELVDERGGSIAPPRRSGA